MMEALVRILQGNSRDVLFLAAIPIQPVEEAHLDTVGLSDLAFDTWKGVGDPDGED